MEEPIKKDPVGNEISNGINGEVEVELAVQKESDGAKQAAKPSYVKFLLPGAILLAALIVSGTLIWTRGMSAGIGKGGSAQIAGNDNKPVDVKVGSNDHMLGNKDAKITIVEFSDFQCPFCRSFWSGTLPQIKRDYIDTGKARFVYKHYPLDFHPGAKPAAEGTECASDQGKFWEMHDKIFEEQAKQGQGTIQFTKQDIAKWATAIGLNMNQFNQCVSSGKYTKLVNDDFAYGSSLGVSGTPTSFINGKRIVGAQPFTSFQAVIEGLLKK